MINSSPLSDHCMRSEHDRCPHSAGSRGVSLLRPLPRSEWELVLCGCACHAGCPLARERTTRDDAWRDSCTCPGSDALRERLVRSEERRREVAGVAGEIRREGVQDAVEIERRLRAVFEARGEAPPPGVTGMSRLAAAGMGARGTRTARLLRLAARAVTRMVREAWQQRRPPSADR